MNQASKILSSKIPNPSTAVQGGIRKIRIATVPFNLEGLWIRRCLPFFLRFSRGSPGRSSDLFKISDGERGGAARLTGEEPRH
jgi:hypothetical protein